jgi:hypothetical protein
MRRRTPSTVGGGGYVKPLGVDVATAALPEAAVALPMNTYRSRTSAARRELPRDRTSRSAGSTTTSADRRATPRTTAPTSSTAAPAATAPRRAAATGTRHCEIVSEQPM